MTETHIIAAIAGVMQARDLLGDRAQFRTRTLFDMLLRALEAERAVAAAIAEDERAEDT